MAQTGFDTFDTTVQQTNELLSTIEERYGWHNRRQQSYQIVRLSLQVLRDRLPVQQSAHLAAQLPLLLKGIYFDGWEPEEVPRKISKAEMVERVRTGFIYSTDRDIETMMKEVYETIFAHVSRGQLEDMKANLPHDVASLLP